MRKTALKRTQALRAGKGKGRYKRPAKTIGAINNKEATGQALQAAELRKLCDKEWALLVKLNANYQCEWCLRQAQDAHHMVSRRHSATRHDPLNGVALCKGCHLRFHNTESLTGWEKFKAQRPLSWERIDSARYATFKPTTEGLRNTLAMLREEIEKLREAA